MIITMLIALVLSWFGLDESVTIAINQMFNTQYTTVIYWLLFFIVGLIIYTYKATIC